MRKGNRWKGVVDQPGDWCNRPKAAKTVPPLAEQRISKSQINSHEPRAQVFFRDLAFVDFFCAAVDDLPAFFFEPLKMRSQPLENFSVEPVWTV